MNLPTDAQGAADEESDAMEESSDLSDASEDSAETFTDEDIDVSGEFRDEINKLEDGVWHAPQGRGTRIVAMIILAGIVLSLIALVVLAILSAKGT